MKVNYKKELENAAKNMILVHEPHLLIKLIVRMLVQKVKISHAGILLYNKKKDTFVLTVSGGTQGIRVPAGFARIDADNPLIDFFQKQNRKNFFSRDVLIYDSIKRKLKSKLSSGTKDTLKKILYQMDIFQTVACVPSYFRDELMAVLLLGEKTDAKSFAREELDFFAALASDVAMAIRNAQLFHDLETELEKKYRLFIHTIVALAAAIEAKDHYTHGHTSRVTNLSLEIARKLMDLDKKSYNEKFLEHLHIASLLHDIGKIGIPESILNKSSFLTEEEKDKMREHVLLGSNILQPIVELEDAILGVKHHHERYDGCGYPSGLKGDEIPILAAIIAVADSFDAMTTDRPYRKALLKSEAMEEIKRLRGKQFNPVIVDAFVELCEEGKI